MFSQIHLRFRSIVEELLEIREEVIDDDAQLAAFRARYSSGGFLCRYQPCSRSTQGFPTAELRVTHEKTHFPRFQCTNSSCAQHGWTFKDSTAMTNHVNKYHPMESVSDVLDTVSQDERSPNQKWNPSSVHSLKAENTSIETFRNFQTVTASRLADLRLEDLSTEHKTQKADWHAVYNPNIRRALDVDFVCELKHDYMVYAIAFSLDGNLIGTGGMYAIDIFETSTFKKIVSFEEPGDINKLFIRFKGICFTSDSRFLATAGDEGLIRVCFLPPNENMD